MKKTFIILFTLINIVFGTETYDNVPTKYKNDITIFSPKENMITIKDSVLIKGQVKSNSSILVNGKSLEINEVGRFYYKQPLTKLGQNEIEITFQNNNDSFKINRSIIKLKNPNSSILNQKELAFINTKYTSKSIKENDLKITFRNEEFAYFLSKITIKPEINSSQTINNINNFQYKNEIKHVIDNNILTLDNNNDFKYKNIINTPIFLTGLTRALDWKKGTNNYPELSKYKDLWYYDYLVIGFDKKIITESDLKDIKKVFKNSDFIKYASRIPEIKNDILAELKFKELPSSKKDKENVLITQKKSTPKKKVIKEKKQFAIHNVKQISKTRKEVTGTGIAKQSFAVNWKKITVNDDGTFKFIVPVNQNKIQLSINNQTYVEDLNIANYTKETAKPIAKIDTKENKQKNMIKKESSIQIKKQAPIIAEYTDLKNHWIKDIANKLKYEEKLDNTKEFKPNKKVSRSDLAKYIVKITGLTQKEYSQSFKDISNKDKNYGYIQNVVSNKLLNGMTKTTFEPDGSVTKLQAIIVASRLLPDLTNEEYESISLPFTDISKYKWATKELQKAYHYKIVSKNRSLNPKKIITNAELVSLLYKTSKSI